MSIALNVTVPEPPTQLEESLSMELRARQQCIAEVTEMIHVKPRARSPSSSTAPTSPRPCTKSIGPLASAYAPPRSRRSEIEKTIASAYAPAAKPSKQGTDDLETPSNNLWVGNLASDVTDSELMDLFAQYGALDSVTTYSSRSYDFVFFKRVEDSAAAKESLQGALLCGNPIKIEFARPPKIQESLYVNGGERSSRSRFHLCPSQILDPEVRWWGLLGFGVRGGGKGRGS
ncbi:hypothetical protein ACE6H2_013920 [Prunus campanulata]